MAATAAAVGGATGESTGLMAGTRGGDVGDSSQYDTDSGGTRLKVRTRFARYFFCFVLYSLLLFSVLFSVSCIFLNSSNFSWLTMFQISVFLFCSFVSGFRLTKKVFFSLLAFLCFCLGKIVWLVTEKKKQTVFHSSDRRERVLGICRCTQQHLKESTPILLVVTINAAPTKSKASAYFAPAPPIWHLELIHSSIHSLNTRYSSGDPPCPIAQWSESTIRQETCFITRFSLISDVHNIQRSRSS